MNGLSEELHSILPKKLNELGLPDVQSVAQQRVLSFADFTESMVD